MSRAAVEPKQSVSTFAALRVPDYRLFITGQLVSYAGMWVQRIAQDWLVFSLTDSVTAVGITSGLQSLPIIVFGPIGGVLADRYPKRRVLLGAQSAAAVIAVMLAVLSFAHVVQAWHVYVAASILGIEFSIEGPARYSFINELVGPTLLRSAVGINASTIQLGGLVGPAISGALLSFVGFGWAFALNALTYAAPILALIRLRHRDLRHVGGQDGPAAGLRAGITYVASRPHVLWPTVLVAVLAMFTMSLPTTLVAYSKTVFHSGASGYGLLSSILAIGSISGALLYARLGRTRLRTALGAAASLTTMFLLAALAPSRASFYVVLVGLGASMMLFFTSTQTALQLAVDDSIRGRVLAIYAVMYFGGGSIGGPLVGWLDDAFGPRIGMLLSGLISATATAIATLALVRRRPPQIARATSSGRESTCVR